MHFYWMQVLLTSICVSQIYGRINSISVLGKHPTETIRSLMLATRHILRFVLSDNVNLFYPVSQNNATDTFIYISYSYYFYFVMINQTYARFLRENIWGIINFRRIINWCINYSPVPKCKKLMHKPEALWVSELQILSYVCLCITVFVNTERARKHHRVNIHF